MDLILLCICSVIIARCLERRMRVASIAHAILFIVLAFFFLFTTDFKAINYAMSNMFGEKNFLIIRNALLDASPFYRSAISTLFIMDIVIEIMACIAAIIVLVKSFRKFSKGINLKKVQIIIKNTLFKYRLIPNKVLLENNRDKYIVLQHLRN